MHLTARIRKHVADSGHPVGHGNSLLTECAAALESQAAELDRLRNAARSRLKCPEGHSPGESRGACWFCDAERNAADLAALRAQPGEETIIDDDYECRHGTTGRMIIFTTCFWCRGKK